MSNSVENVIVVHVVGGLGNQMFQYACGRAAAARCGGRLLLDLSAFERYKLHSYGLDGYRISAKTAPRRLQTSSVLQASLRHLGLAKPWQMKVQGFEYILENQDFEFQSRILAQHKKVYLEGYWQDERYFADFADLIRADFRPRCPGNTTYTNTIADGSLLVSLHIRRGDYLDNPIANSVHGVLGLNYYQEAVELMVRRIGERFRIVVFSDDIEWARQNLCFQQPLSFVRGSAATPYEDLLTMASCDHHIIANSSFSWWGAWLNPSLTKVVITPRRWYAAPELAHHNICPSSWERI
ncbi:alpha-1,2-fucosyltransferase [Rhodobacterales bacterium LSUCC0031]|nr:alpha-1,2-fucosyltransferase [Rhodobacterales bacterium LSUCC0031]